MAKQKPKISQKKTSDSILLQAIKNKASVEVIRELQEIETTNQRDRSRLAYIDAMIKFQEKLPDLTRTSKGTAKDGKEYWYTPLQKLRKVLQPLITKNGFTYHWDSKNISSEQVEWACIVTHKDGHSEVSRIVADRDNTENMIAIHSVGSTQTYLMRRTFIAIFGITTADEDNDGATSKSKKETIPDPEAISNEREELEKMELEELALKIHTISNGDKLLNDYITKVIGKKADSKFTDKDKAKIKKFIIDTIV